MLINAVSIIALLATLTAGLAYAGLAAARITLLVRAQTAVASGITQGTSSLVSALASAIAANASLDPVPSFTPLPPSCADAACSMTVQETIAIAQSGASANAPNLQSNGYITERRLAARITVNVVANGAVLVTRSHDVVVRETLTPPYASIAGVLDADAGTIASSPLPCASPSPAVSADTAVRAEYHDVTGTQCADAGAWADGSYAAVPQNKGWSP